jgi:hypothetical protein
MPETVTVRNPEICSAEFESPDVTPRSHVEGGETLNSAITVGDRARLAVVWAKELYAPPPILTQRPPSVSALAAYAKHGAWTRGRSGFLRGAGVAWFRFVGVPVTVLCRAAEWIWQRPGRAVPVAVLVKVLAHTSPGRWLVDAGSYVVGALAWALF